MSDNRPSEQADWQVALKPVHLADPAPSLVRSSSDPAAELSLVEELASVLTHLHGLIDELNFRLGRIEAGLGIENAPPRAVATRPKRTPITTDRSSSSEAPGEVTRAFLKASERIRSSTVSPGASRPSGPTLASVRGPEEVTGTDE